MAGMSNEEYERVVAELRASKAHRGDPLLQGLIQSNACSLVKHLHFLAKEGLRLDPGGPFVATTARAADLERRVRGLTIWQATEALVHAARPALRHHLTPPSADVLDRELAAVAAELSNAEVRPRGE